MKSLRRWLLRIAEALKRQQRENELSAELESRVLDSRTPRDACGSHGGVAS